MILPQGKLPPDLLAALLAQVPPDPRVIVGPGVGEDAAVLDMGDRYLVAKTDPITFATDAIGWYAVQVNANDLATTGATPRWFLATTILPGGQADQAMVEEIFGQIMDACQASGITLVGGHTEITHGIDRPLVVGTLLGEVAKDQMIRTGGAQPGDVVLLTKGVPIEATAIIAREKRLELQAHFDAGFLDRAAAFLHSPGISVLRDAQLAVQAGRVTSMHDPTEGGLATALWELAEASGHTVQVTVEQWPILEEGRRLCAHYGLDPLGAIASGALLLTATAETAAVIRDKLAQAAIPVYELGVIKSGPPTVLYREALLSRPTRDEITRLFE